MQLPTSLENQSLFRPASNQHTTGTVSSLSQSGILLFGVTEIEEEDKEEIKTYEYRVVGDVPEYVDGQVVNARWAIVEGSAREV